VGDDNTVSIYTTTATKMRNTSRFKGRWGTIKWSGVAHLSCLDAVLGISIYLLVKASTIVGRGE